MCYRVWLIYSVNMYKQSNEWGCALYAVANACQLPESFITEERLEASKAGNNVGQLTLWLNQDGYKIYPQPLYYNALPNCKELPKEHTMYDVPGTEDEGLVVMPMLFYVKRKDSKVQHMVGAHLDQKGLLTIFDSKEPEPIETSLYEINDIYPEVFGLVAMCDIETAQFAVFK
jgi:hypothetical protein